MFVRAHFVLNKEDSPPQKSLQKFRCAQKGQDLPFVLGICALLHWCYPHVLNHRAQEHFKCLPMNVKEDIEQLGA